MNQVTNKLVCHVMKEYTNINFFRCQMLLPLSCVKPDASIVVIASSRGKLVNRTSAFS